MELFQSDRRSLRAADGREPRRAALDDEFGCARGLEGIEAKERFDLVGASPSTERALELCTKVSFLRAARTSCRRTDTSSSASSRTPRSATARGGAARCGEATSSSARARRECREVASWSRRAVLSRFAERGQLESSPRPRALRRPQRQRGIGEALVREDHDSRRQGCGPRARSPDSGRRGQRASTTGP